VQLRVQAFAKLKNTKSGLPYMYTVVVVDDHWLIAGRRFLHIAAQGISEGLHKEFDTIRDYLTALSDTVMEQSGGKPYTWHKVAWKMTPAEARDSIAARERRQLEAALG